MVGQGARCVAGGGSAGTYNYQSLLTGAPSDCGLRPALPNLSARLYLLAVAEFCFLVMIRLLNSVEIKEREREKKRLRDIVNLVQYLYTLSSIYKCTHYQSQSNYYHSNRIYIFY